MKATEQLSALEMMAVDPFRRVLAPRWLAGFISLPLLAAVFSAVGILGGYLVGVKLLGLDPVHVANEGRFAAWVPAGTDGPYYIYVITDAEHQDGSLAPASSKTAAANTRPRPTSHSSPRSVDQFRNRTGAHADCAVP